MLVRIEKCKGCGACVQDCPQAAIRLVKKKAHIGEACSQCGACLKTCPEDALFPEDAPAANAVSCEACPIRCSIKEGYTGACQRFINRKGVLERTISLQSFEAVKHLAGPDWKPAIRTPLVTGIGAGTTYPDCKPAPHIVQSRVEGIDVVTVVTEAPLSYSGIKVKIDTDRYVGEEGAAVYFRKKKVGHLTTEEYGSKMLSLGGVNLLTSGIGLTAARLVADLANRRSAKLKIEGGSRLEVQVGSSPVIDGEIDDVMRVGCGSATLGLFAGTFKEVADETIVLDSHLTGLLSEHAAGIYVGAQPTGVKLRFKKSTPGRYFGDHGGGWGGTSITDPKEIIQYIDMSVARPGMTVLITETTGRKAVLLRVKADGTLEDIGLNAKARKAVTELAATCQEARVSAVYCGGSGGSARAGVTRYPVKLTHAVHLMKARLTVGGAPTFVLPGGGINFMVDVEKVMPGAFTWVPTPAIVCPIEYTMTLEDFRDMGGHDEAIKPFRKK
ncbi:MAG TPA: 4Fe-4S dicluster domain-containing protein [Desulfomonilaceae bacterium]|nr:4Fe-4S dicluster domain-containing protein [Desulfomonilaceae bacterium]